MGIKADDILQARWHLRKWSGDGEHRHHTCQQGVIDMVLAKKGLTTGRYSLFSPLSGSCTSHYGTSRDHANGKFKRCFSQWLGWGLVPCILACILFLLTQLSQPCKQAAALQHAQHDCTAQHNNSTSKHSIAQSHKSTDSWHHMRC